MFSVESRYRSADCMGANGVTGAVFLDGDGQIAAVGPDRVIRLWDVDTTPRDINRRVTATRAFVFTPRTAERSWSGA
jgi:hypothetical protein